MPFETAASIIGQHLIVQPADARLGPPESYFYVQDGLIISCGVLYAFCYFFYAIRTYKDKVLAGPVEYMSVASRRNTIFVPAQDRWRLICDRATTMAYELYYAFATTTTPFEFWCFIVWFLFDVAFVIVALVSAYPRDRRLNVVLTMVTGVAAGIILLKYLCILYPDDREQITAFWVGVVLQFPISWGSLFLLLSRQDTKGHSLEVWYAFYMHLSRLLLTKLITWH